MALSFTYRLAMDQGSAQSRAVEPSTVCAPIPALDQSFTGTIAGASGWNLEPEATPMAPLPPLDAGSSSSPLDPTLQSGLGFSCLDLLTAFSEGPP